MVVVSTVVAVGRRGFSARAALLPQQGPHASAAQCSVRHEDRRDLWFIPRGADGEPGQQVYPTDVAGRNSIVFLVRPPGVYRVDSDTSLLIDVVREGGYAAGRRVLDLGTGTGALAVAAAWCGAASVTAVDLSLRSVAAAWLNSRLHRVACRVRRGDLCGPVAGERFDLILANPPYVPAASDVLPRHRMSRCWDAGLDGRVLLDRICAEAPVLLAPEAQMLVVHSAVCDEDITLKRFADAGLQAEVLTRRTVPFGPVMRARAAMLETRGLVEPGQREEQLVVIGARRVP